LGKVQKRIEGNSKGLKKKFKQKSENIKGLNKFKSLNGKLKTLNGKVSRLNGWTNSLNG